jgi:hypothetical protein
MYIELTNIQDAVKFLTSEKIRLSSSSGLPNKDTSSHHLFGYDNLLSKIIRASIPVAVVPCLHVYLSDKLRAWQSRCISVFRNLKSINHKNEDSIVIVHVKVIGDYHHANCNAYSIYSVQKSIT